MQKFVVNPFYLEAVECYLSANSERVQVLIDSDKLDRCEKNLIQARLHLRDREWDLAEASLQPASTVADFYLGELHFLRGNLRGFHARWEEAVLENLQAYKHFKACDNQRGLFLTAYNLSVDYSSLGLFQISSKYLLEAEKNTQSGRHQSQIFRGLAWNYLQNGEVQNSLKAVEAGFALGNHEYPSEKNMFLAVAADIYFRVGKTDEAFGILQGLRYSKAVRDKSRIHLEFKILEKLRTESRPYRSLEFPSDELNLSGEYRLKWNVLRSLLNGEKLMAEKYWSELCVLFPRRYLPKYGCADATESKSIFMIFLNKILEAPVKVDFASPKSDAKFFSSKQSQLLDLLMNHPSGLRKEELIEQLWQKAYDPSMDAKLYKLIQRIREQAHFEILSQNQSYHLKKLGS